MTIPISPARRLRRYFSGAALVLFPALLVIEGPLDPTNGGTGAVYWAAATHHAGALIASALLLLVSGALMAPAVSGILHQARDRGSALANVGAVLGLLGGLGHVGLSVVYVAALSLAGGDRSEMVHFMDRFGTSTTVGAIFFPLLMCFGLGLLFLAWAVWRAGMVRIWGPIVVSVAVAAHVVLPDGLPVIEFAALAALAVVFGSLGLRVLRMTDTEWDGVRSAPVAPQKLSV